MSRIRIEIIRALRISLFVLYALPLETLIFGFLVKKVSGIFWRARDKTR